MFEQREFLQAACNKHYEFARLEELEGYNRVSCSRTLYTDSSTEWEDTNF